MKHEREPKPVKMQKVRLLDGPHRGEIIEVPINCDYKVVGIWLYQYVGKDGGNVVWARAARTRAAGRFALQVIRDYGKHPALLREWQKPLRVQGTMPKQERRAFRRWYTKARKRSLKMRMANAA